MELTEEMGEKPISYSAFTKAPYLHTYIDMKCLNCDFEIRSHFGEYGMDMDEERLPFPIDWCPECETQHLVPKDVYDKLTLKVSK